MTTFIASGADVVANPNVNTNNSAGRDGAGQITLSDGSQPFPDSYIVEFTVIRTDADGEFRPNIAFTKIVVYETAADFQAGTPIYTYEPQNPGRSANIQNSTDGIGDSYVRFNASAPVPDDAGAPNLSLLFVAPGSNVANQSSVTLNHHTDHDCNQDGTVSSGTTEDGDGRFNVDVADLHSPICYTAGAKIKTPRGHIAVENLKVGDLVSTVDSGPQPVL